MGAEYQSFDATKQRIDAILRERLDPRVQGVTIHEVGPYARGNAVIVHVPQSWSGPHMVSFGQTHFYSRNNSGRHPLDVHEIRAAYLAGSDVGRRVENFRDARIGKILANETPAALAVGPKIIVHVVPLALSTQINLAQSNHVAPLGLTGGSYNSRYNLDGFLTFNGNDKMPSYGYSLVFRNGCYEGVTVDGVRLDKTPPSMYGTGIETDVVRGIARFVKFARGAGVSGPMSLLVTLVDVKGNRMVVDDYHHSRFEQHTIDRDPLILPDVLLESDSEELTQLLKPAFDTMWQASGYERSPGYGQNGEWDQSVHPGR